MKLEIREFTVGEVQTNCYFGINQETRELFVVDPGDSPEALAQKIQEEGFFPKAILLTHGHFDHAMGAARLAELLGVEIYAHEKEQEVLKQPGFNLSGMIGRNDSYHADVYVKDGQVLDIAGFSIKVLHTPGHTPGGCSYYIESESVLFSGDTLFCQSVGRTDFPGSSMGDIVRSIREKLFVLPEQTRVYPGHMEQTTIGEEIRTNPFV